MLLSIYFNTIIYHSFEFWPIYHFWP